MALRFTGGGIFISQPLAIVVIGGLISSTLLTLVLVPVLYVLAARVRSRPAVLSAVLSAERTANRTPPPRPPPRHGDISGFFGS